MGILRNPNDSVPKMVSMPRWEREWVNAHYSINFSGLVQEMVVELIKQYDPKYYDSHKSWIEISVIKRRDFIQNMVERHPEIMPKI